MPGEPSIKVMVKIIQEIAPEGLDAFDRELVEFVFDRYGEPPLPVAAALVWLSACVKAGHVALPLNRRPSEWRSLIGAEQEAGAFDEPVTADQLAGHPLAGTGGEPTVLRIDGDRLYFGKLYNQEVELGERLLALASEKQDPGDDDRIGRLLDRHFPELPDHGLDWQRAAAILSLVNRFLVISGGPGTGKTTTVSRIAKLHAALADRPFRVAMTAPTGKAASRMGEAIREGLESGDDPEAENLRVESGTLHRLLLKVEQGGMLPAAWDRTLPYDMVVVDEASMLDPGLAVRLLRHLSPVARLILLGDRDQLSSVEAGSVIADICRKEKNRFGERILGILNRYGQFDTVDAVACSDLEESIVYLEKSWRFHDESGIARLADEIRNVEAGRAGGLFGKSRYIDLKHKKFDWTSEDTDKLLDRVGKRLRKAADLDGEKLLGFWKEEIWLTLHRRGRYGSRFLNEKIDRRAQRLATELSPGGWYHGRPVMITRNDHSNGLYNGDLGVCSHSGAGRFSVLFFGPNGSLREIPVHRLREFEPAFLLTVHKSQGSEFDVVHLLLPGEDTQLLTRELLYTAVTRARNGFTLHGDLSLFSTGAGRRMVRLTGLGDRLHDSGKHGSQRTGVGPQRT